MNKLEPIGSECPSISSTYWSLATFGYSGQFEAAKRTMQPEGLREVLLAKILCFIEFVGVTWRGASCRAVFSHIHPVCVISNSSCNISRKKNKPKPRSSADNLQDGHRTWLYNYNTYTNCIALRLPIQLRRQCARVPIAGCHWQIRTEFVHIWTTGSVLVQPTDETQNTCIENEWWKTFARRLFLPVFKYSLAVAVAHWPTLKRTVIFARARAITHKMCVIFHYMAHHKVTIEWVCLLAELGDWRRQNN